MRRRASLTMTPPPSCPSELFIRPPLLLQFCTDRNDQAEAQISDPKRWASHRRASLKEGRTLATPAAWWWHLRRSQARSHRTMVAVSHPKNDAHRAALSRPDPRSDQLRKDAWSRAGGPGQVPRHGDRQHVHHVHRAPSPRASHFTAPGRDGHPAGTSWAKRRSLHCAWCGQCWHNGCVHESRREAHNATLVRCDGTRYSRPPPLHCDDRFGPVM